MYKILIISMLFLLVGCTSISKKSWGSAGSTDAFDVKTSYDPKSGSVTPEIVAGGGSHVMMFALPRQQKEQYPTMFGYSSRLSLWGLFGGTQAGNVSFLYISGSNETPEQTIKILDKIKSLTQKTNVKDK